LDKVELSEDSPSVSSLTLQEKLYYVNLHFTYLKQGFDEELSNYQDDLYPQEVTDLYIEIKALMKNLDIDKRSDPQRPSMLVNDDKAQGTSINCLIVNPKNLKQLKSRTCSQQDLYFSRCPSNYQGKDD